MEQPSGSPRLFIAALAVVPLAFLFGAVTVARSHWFITRAVPPYITMLDEEFSVRNRPCDILIFGDSSALTGIMPWRVQQASGLQACSIAQTKGSIGVTGTWFLERYLQRNPAPAVLVLAFAAEDWRASPPAGDEVHYVEGLLQLVRHGSADQNLLALVRHPNQAFGFATWVWKAAFAALVSHRSYPAGLAHDGFMTLPAPPQKTCMATPRPYAAPQPDYVTSLRRKFSTDGTRVLLLVTPVPDCDAQKQQYAQALQPLTSNQMESYPVSLYNGLDRHFTAAGAERFSTEVARIVTRTR